MATTPPAHPEGTSPFTYEITEVSPGCTKYKVGQGAVFYENDPPPQTITKSYAAPCTSVVYTLTE